MTILAPYSVDPDQLASQKLADLDLHSKEIVISGSILNFFCVFVEFYVHKIWRK